MGFSLFDLFFLFELFFSKKKKEKKEIEKKKKKKNEIHRIKSPNEFHSICEMTLSLVFVTLASGWFFNSCKRKRTRKKKEKCRINRMSLFL